MPRRARPFLRRRLRGAGVLLSGLLVCGLLAPAFANPLSEGSMAPAVEGKEFFNTEPFQFEDLGGRLILLELFATG